MKKPSEILSRLTRLLKKGLILSNLTSLSRRSFLIMPLALAACKTGSSVIEILGYSMGTTYKVAVVDHTGQLEKADVQTAINGSLARVNALMSNWDAGSEISRFNAQSSTESLPVSAELAEVMEAAEYVNAASAGRFDTTIGPMIELWGFGAPGRGNMPTVDAIETARATSGHANTLRIGAGSLQKVQPDTQVYLAAIGKGYGADHIGRALADLGVEDYMVEIGGDLFVSGRNAEGLPWQIGIETPNAANRGVMGVVGVSNMGLAFLGRLPQLL